MADAIALGFLVLCAVWFVMFIWMIYVTWSEW